MGCGIPVDLGRHDLQDPTCKAWPAKLGMEEAKLGHVLSHDEAMAELYAVIDAAEANRDDDV